MPASARKVVERMVIGRTVIGGAPARSNRPTILQKNVAARRRAAAPLSVACPAARRYTRRRTRLLNLQPEFADQTAPFLFFRSHVGGVLGRGRGHRLGAVQMGARV